MDEKTIAAQIKAFLEEAFPNQGVELNEETDLLEEWFIDSLGIIETVLFLEKRFGIDVARADISGVNFKNIAALTKFVSRQLAK